MAAALELMIIPALVFLAVIVLGVIADLSAQTIVAGGVVAALLVFAVSSLLRKEKEWEGPGEHHEHLSEDPDR